MFNGLFKKITVRMGLVTVVVYWLVESIIHISVFGKDLVEAFFPLSDLNELWTRIFIVFLFFVFGFYAQTMIEELKVKARQRERLIDELRGSVEEIKALRGIIPICASCKRVRDGNGYWSQVETYLRDHSNADFTHTCCPKCVTKLYEEGEQFATDLSEQ